MTDDEVQKLIDKAYTGVVEQGQLSVDINGACRYRMVTDKGQTLKCGVGHLIPDLEYTSRLEGHVCAGKLIRSVLTKTYGDFSDLQWSAITAVQGAHDYSSSLVGSTDKEKLDDFKEHCLYRVHEYGYTVPEVSQ